jgi:hypothetical protein
MDLQKSWADITEEEELLEKSLKEELEVEVDGWRTQSKKNKNQRRFDNDSSSSSSSSSSTTSYVCRVCNRKCIVGEEQLINIKKEGWNLPKTCKPCRIVKKRYT